MISFGEKTWPRRRSTRLRRGWGRKDVVWEPSTEDSVYGPPEAVELGDLIHEICERLDIAPDDVANLNIDPDRITILRYERNEAGAKYIDPETERIAQNRLVVAIRTDLSDEEMKLIAMRRVDRILSDE